ncbi:MAG TPA: tetratricopeptide repeat protein, partial [Planctomycetota bacterium]|nr:tetratricopeptide repeat protein [Planctomycetota bacterium]
GDGVDTEEERFHLGLALAKRGRTEDAVAELADLLAIDPWFERAYYQLGLSLARLGRTDDAEIFFERARSLAASERDIRREREHQAAGDPVLAARSRARGHLARNQFEEAEATLRKPELDGEPAHLVDRIYLYLHSLRIDDARRELERLESIVGETHQSVIGHRALIAWELGDRDRALHELRTLASGANAARVWRLRFAELLIDAERYEEAARLVSPLRTSAKDADATIVLGRAKLELDEPAAAADLLASISPTDTRRDAWSVDAWLALALARAGKPQRALETLGERGAHGRGREVELRARAAALEALGAMGEAAQADVDAAKNAFARARRIAPEIRSLRERVARTRWRSDCEARLELARAFASAGDIDAAIREARLILHACPNHAGALENLVDWHDRPGDAFVRIDLLRRLVEARPDDPEAKRRLRELEAVWIASRERTKPSQ